MFRLYRKTGVGRKGKAIALLLSSAALVLSLPQQADACLRCNQMVSTYDNGVWGRAVRDFDNKLDSEFVRLEKFIVYTMWRQNILPILMLSAEQFTAVAMQQVAIIGTFLDAKHQMETQQLLQELQARAHKDYHPSEGMCELGTAVKALAAADQRAEFSHYIFSQKAQDRHMGAMLSGGAYGFGLEKEYRIAQFRSRYCNEKDRAGALGGRSGSSRVALDSVCPNMAIDTMNPEDRERINRDIDYFSSVDSPWTVRVNFTNDKIFDDSVTPEIHNEDEEHIFALESNLFASELFARPPGKSLQHRDGEPLSSMQQAFMDMRAIEAKRSVAENSFHAIAGEKSEGPMAMDDSGDPVPSASAQDPMRSREYMKRIMENLGVPDTETLKLLGENPSYDAHMEILTKKIFQNPDFYTNLYDKPANVKRKGVTLQAIKMMQKFDMLKSTLRGEASFSVLLELAVVNLQREIEAQIK